MPRIRAVGVEDGATSFDLVVSLYDRSDQAVAIRPTRRRASGVHSRGSERLRRTPYVLPASPAALFAAGHLMRPPFTTAARSGG